MKIAILNKSDSTGGAAVVSRRLMEALREEGVDARMLVCEKLTDSPYVEVAAGEKKIKWEFVKERLKIYLANGLNRKTLFKIDTASDGLPLWKHPIVKDSDAVLINWVNQGMLSLSGFKKILQMGKPVIWTMHDMWCMTGICHHAGRCNNYERECGDCPLLGKKGGGKDLSYEIWRKKNIIYGKKELTQKLAFVAVSSWLKDKTMQSSLMKKQRVVTIPNAFKVNTYPETIYRKANFDIENPQTIRILFGAARLDDPIKGLETLKETSRILKKDFPDEAAKLEIVLFGTIKDEKALEGFALPVRRLGLLKGEEEVRKAYENSQILVSASSYETLPGTLVEAQAYGCIPVSFNQGGQGDIIDQLSTGYMAEYSEDIEIRGRNLANGIIWAISIFQDRNRYEKILERMKISVEEKFSYKQIAGEYISLIQSMRSNN